MRQIGFRPALSTLALLLATQLTLGAAPGAAGDLTRGIRMKASAGDLRTGEALLEEWRGAHGEDDEWLDGLGWLARGAQLLGQDEIAMQYVRELRQRIPVEQEGRIVPLGAAIEVEGRVILERDGRGAALTFWAGELARARHPALASRIVKNMNLVALEGSPAPEIDFGDSLGPRLGSLAELRGRPVLLYFWAHWCGDCRAQAPAVARLAAKYGPRGLAVVAPTRYYGSAENGRKVEPDEERRHVASVLATGAEGFETIPVPISEAAMVRYGASATPTFALVDRRGDVRFYAPTRLSEAELERRIEALLDEPVPGPEAHEAR